MGFVLILITYIHLVNYTNNISYDLGILYGDQNKIFSETQPFPYGYGLFFNSKIKSRKSRKMGIFWGFKLNLSNNKKFFSPHILIDNKIEWLKSNWLLGFPEIYLGTHWSVDHSTKAGMFLYHTEKFYYIKFNLLVGGYYSRYAKFKKNAWLKTGGNQGVNFVGGLSVWKEYKYFGFHLQYQVEGPLLKTHFKHNAQLKLSILKVLSNNQKLAFNLLLGFTYFDPSFYSRSESYLGFSFSILKNTKSERRGKLNKRVQKKRMMEEKIEQGEQSKMQKIPKDTSQVTVKIIVLNSSGWNFLPPFEIICFTEPNDTLTIIKQNNPVLINSRTYSIKIRKLIWEELAKHNITCELHLYSNLYKVKSPQINRYNFQIKFILVPKWK